MLFVSALVLTGSGHPVMFCPGHLGKPFVWVIWVRPALKIIWVWARLDHVWHEIRKYTIRWWVSIRSLLTVKLLIVHCTCLLKLAYGFVLMTTNYEWPNVAMLKLKPINKHCSYMIIWWPQILPSNHYPCDVLV